MNKQLIILATLVASQASIQAVDASYFEQFKTCGQNAKAWASTTVRNGTNASRAFVAEAVASVMNSQVQKPSYFETFKNNMIAAKDVTIGYVASINRPTIPSWETTKNVANDLKNSTSNAIKEACESIKENAPVYFEAAKNYAEENPGKVAAITLGSMAAMIAIYKTVKYLRNSDELYRDYDSVVEPVKHTFRKK